MCPSDPSCAAPRAVATGSRNVEIQLPQTARPIPSVPDSGSPVVCRVCHARIGSTRSRRRPAGSVVLVAARPLAPGCSRKFFRERADKDVAGVITQKNVFPDWQVKNWHVYPDPRARFADPSQPGPPAVPAGRLRRPVLSPEPAAAHEEGRRRAVRGRRLPRAARAVGRREPAAGATAADDADGRHARPKLPPPKPAASAGRARARRLGTTRGVTPPRRGRSPRLAAPKRQARCRRPIRRPARPERDRRSPVRLPGSANKTDPRPSDSRSRTRPEGEAQKGRTGRPPTHGRDRHRGSPPPTTSAPSPPTSRATGIKLEQAVELGLLQQPRVPGPPRGPVPRRAAGDAGAVQLRRPGVLHRDRSSASPSAATLPGGAGERWRFNTDAGFTKLFPTGALLLVRLANQVVIDLVRRPARRRRVSNLTLSLVQPFLRGGGYAVTLEPLTRPSGTCCTPCGRTPGSASCSTSPSPAGGGLHEQPLRPPGAVAEPRPRHRRQPDRPDRRLPAAAAPVGRSSPTSGRTSRRWSDCCGSTRRSARAGSSRDLQVGQVEVQLLNSRGAVARQSAGGGGGGGGGIRGYLDALDNFKLQLGLPVTVGAGTRRHAAASRSASNSARFEDVYAAAAAAGSGGRAGSTRPTPVGAVPRPVAATAHRVARWSEGRRSRRTIGDRLGRVGAS